MSGARRNIQVEYLTYNITALGRYCANSHTIAFLIFNKTILKLYTFCPAKAKKRNFLPSFFEKNTTFAAVNHNFNRIMDDYYADSNKRN